MDKTNLLILCVPTQQCRSSICSPVACASMQHEIVINIIMIVKDVMHRDVIMQSVVLDLLLLHVQENPVEMAQWKYYKVGSSRKN